MAFYIESHDNHHDIILTGHGAAIARLNRLRMPCSDGDQAIFNPSGPDNNPAASNTDRLSHFHSVGALA